MSAASKTVDEPAEEAAAPPSLALRAKRLLIAPLLLLKRLRRPKAVKQSEEAEEAQPRAGNARRGASEETETAPAAALPLWRRLLPYGLLLLAGTAAGGGAIYWLSAQVIAHQSTELSEQADDIARLKGVLAGYDRMMLENHRKLETEKGKRAELGNRLAIAQSDLTRRPPPREAPAAPSVAAPSASGQPSPARGQTEAGKTGDCTLRPGSIGSTLKSCLEEFNRP